MDHTLTEYTAASRYERREKNDKAITTSVIVILVLIVLVLLARYVVFPEQAQERGDNLEKLGQWEENYKAEHPDPSDAEVNVAFEAAWE